MARQFKHLVGTGQSIYDLALQFYGDTGKAIKIVKDNDNIDSVEDDISGKTILVEIINEDIVKALRNEQKNISTT